MTVLLELVGKAALGELFKRLTEFAIRQVSQLPSFAGGSAKEGAEEFVRLNLQLPEGTSKAEARVAIREATALVVPSFEQIMRFNPTTREIERRSGISSSGGWRTSVKKAPAKKAAAKKTVARKVSAKKAPAKKVAAKKAPAKKAAAKKSVRRSVR